MKYKIWLVSLLFFAGCALNDPADYRARISEQTVKEWTQADTVAETQFGRSVAARFLYQHDGVEDAAVQKYVNSLGQYLTQYATRGDLSFYFYVVKSDVVNAYAMPGGYIFITNAALSLMRNEAELAGVLAHEIAHVQQRHIVNALNIRAFENEKGLTQLMSGANDAIRISAVSAVDAVMSMLQTDGLQVKDEYEADEIALIILYQSGYDVRAYSNYLGRLANVETGIEELNQTHPPFDSRIQALVMLTDELGLQEEGKREEDRFLSIAR